MSKTDLSVAREWSILSLDFAHEDPPTSTGSSAAGDLVQQEQLRVWRTGTATRCVGRLTGDPIPFALSCSQPDAIQQLCRARARGPFSQLCTLRAANVVIQHRPCAGNKLWC